MNLPFICDEQGLPTDTGNLPCVVSDTQINPPPWDRAPEGPYLYDLMGDHPFLVSLGGDFLGYIVPDYDFQAGEAPGSHYEETNSASEYLTTDWLTHITEALTKLNEAQPD